MDVSFFYNPYVLFIIGYSSLVIISSGILLYRRSQPALTTRSISWTMVGVWSAYLLSCFLLVKEGWPDVFLCILHLWSCALLFPLWAITFIIRAFKHVGASSLISSIPMHPLKSSKHQQCRTEGVFSALHCTTSKSKISEKLTQQEAKIVQYMKNWTGADNDLPRKFSSVNIIDSESSEAMNWQKTLNQYTPSISTISHNIFSSPQFIEGVSSSPSLSLSKLYSRVSLFFLFHILLTTVIQIPTAESFVDSGECNLELTVLTAVAAWSVVIVYFVIVFPSLFFIVKRNSHGDNEGIKMDLLILLILFPTCSLGYLITSFALSDKDSFPGSYWAIGGFVMFHIISMSAALLKTTHASPFFKWPQYGDKDHEKILAACNVRFRNGKPPAFEEVLENPQLLASFKMFSRMDYSVENILFYQDYLRLNQLLSDEKPTVIRLPKSQSDSPDIKTKNDINTNNPDIKTENDINTDSTISSTSSCNTVFNHDNFMSSKKKSVILSPQLSFPSMVGSSSSSPLYSSSYSSSKFNMKDPIPILSNPILSHPISTVTSATHSLKQSLFSSHSSQSTLLSPLSLSSPSSPSYYESFTEIFHYPSLKPYLEQIYHLYIAVGSELELNIKASKRQEVKQLIRLTYWDGTGLQHIQSEVLELMRRNTYPRWCDWIQREQQLQSQLRLQNSNSYSTHMTNACLSSTTPSLSNTFSSRFISILKKFKF